MKPNISPEQILEAHTLYCQLTGQRITLRFDRQHAWFDFLGAGYCLEDLRRVILYLQREIRAQRRNVGALKLSNLLQLDRFEEDWNISRIRLRPPKPAPSVPAPASSDLSEHDRQAGRQRALQLQAELRSKTGL